MIHALNASPHAHVAFDFGTAVSHIPGWLTEAEGRILFEVAKRTGSDLAVVEIGSWKGRSTVCLGRGSCSGSRATVYAIDPHHGSIEHRVMFGSVDTFAEFCRTIDAAGVDDLVVPVRQTSAAASTTFTRPVGLLFIDGDHRFRGIREDLRLWVPAVVNGGIIAVHDSWHMLMPQLATALLLCSSGRIRNPRLNDTLTTFEIVGRNSPADRVRNIWFVLKRMVTGWRGFQTLQNEGSVI